MVTWVAVKMLLLTRQRAPTVYQPEKGSSASSWKKSSQVTAPEAEGEGCRQGEETAATWPIALNWAEQRGGEDAFCREKPLCSAEWKRFRGCARLTISRKHTVFSSGTNAKPLQEILMQILKTVHPFRRISSNSISFWGWKYMPIRISF